jgi:hypothetical protein
MLIFQRLSYTVNMRTRQCNVTAFTSPFSPWGVPREGTVVAEFTIGDPGVPGQGLTAVAFNGTDQWGGEIINN